MKSFFYKLGKQTAVTAVMLLLVFAPFQTLIAQAQTAADTAQTFITPPSSGGIGTESDQSTFSSGSDASILQQSATANIPSSAGTTNTNAFSASGGTTFVPSTNQVSTQNGGTGNASTPLPPSSTAPKEGVFDSCSTSFSVSGCVLAFVYAFTIGIASVFAYVAAYFFDIAIQLSLNGSSYGLDFVSTSWTTARDLGNMAFLFILLYIAFTIIFKADTGQTKTMLAIVIIVALLVNFSFFFTRVVIDAGNILAIQFYNAIPAPPISQTIQGSPISGTASSAASVAGVAGGTKDLTAGIMNMLNVQGLLNNNSFQSTQGKFVAIVFIYIAGAIVLWILTVAFITNGIKFLFRVVVLWFLIVASPLALIAIAIEGGMNGYFKKWREMLVQHAFYPVAFMFVFLILNNFAVTMSTNNGLVGGVFTTLQTSTDGSQTWSAIGAALVSLFIRLVLVIGVLYVAMQVSTRFSIAGASYAEKAGSWFGSKVFWPARLLGREGVGRAAYSINENMKKNPSTNWAGRLLDRGVTSATRPLANAKYGGAVSYSDVAKARKTAGTETNNALRDQDNKAKIKSAESIEKALAPLTKIEKDFKELNSLQAKAAAGTATAAEQTRIAALAAAGTRDLTASEKKQKAELETKYEDVKTRVKNLNKREIEALSTDELKSIAHLMSENQIKTIKDGDKSDKDKEDIKNNWEEKSEEAPFSKSIKKLDDVAKGSAGAAAAIAALKATSNATVDGAWSKSTLKTIVEADHRATTVAYTAAESDFRDAVKDLRAATTRHHAANTAHAAAPTAATQAALNATALNLTAATATHTAAKTAMTAAHATRQATQEAVDAYKDFEKNRVDIQPNENINSKGAKGTFKASLLP